MDTSKEYIKMCEKAIEVQESWTPGCGDLVIRAENYKTWNGEDWIDNG